MTDNTPTFRRLHAVYVSLTGMDIPFTFERLHAWEMFCARGHDEEQLRIVIRHIQSMIRQRKRQVASLKFHNLIHMTEFFAEDLAEARLLARGPVVDHGRERVLKATGRAVAPVAETVRTAAQVLAGMEALREFQRLKETL